MGTRTCVDFFASRSASKGVLPSKNLYPCEDRERESKDDRRQWTVTVDGGQRQTPAAVIDASVKGNVVQKHSL